MGLLAVLFAQACVGPLAAPPASPTPPTTQTAQTAQTAQTTQTTQTTQTAQPTAPAPTATAGAATATPSPTASRLGVAGSPATPRPTEPLLGIDPPVSPAVRPVGSPGTPASPASPAGIRARDATIMEIQGTAARSTLAPQTVRTRGVVTADFQGVPDSPSRGFFMQDAQGDGNSATSDGLFVYQGDRQTPDVKVGDAVTAMGIVSEFDGRTQLDISLAGSQVAVTSSGNRLPEPVELQPPAQEAAALGYFERLEGMLARVPPALVVGPTSRFGEFTVVRQDSGVARVFQGSPRGTGERIVVDDEGGPEARYELAVGDQVTGLIGPLDYTFGQYRLQQLPEAKLLVVPGERTFAAVAPAGPAEFTVASFNVENLFDPLDTPDKQDPCDRDAGGNPCRERWTADDYQRKLTKAALAIRDGLGAPTLVALQEVESLEVLEALAATPELAPLGYGAVLLEGLDPRGIDAGLLYRRGRVTVEGASQRNACTTRDYGFTEAEARCSSRGDGNLDGHYISARPPLIVSLAVRDGSGGAPVPLTLIVNHFKSKSGDDPEDREFVGRRGDEARLVATLVNEIVARDRGANVIVLGDLNDFADSEPLRILTTGAPLRNLTPAVPEEGRYSYIFNGVSQVLDHILITPGLAASLLDVTFAHFDADYPASRASDRTLHRVSDHDPPVARFQLQP